MENVTAVVSAICNEPEGEVRRFVYRMPLTIDNLRNFWEKSRRFKTLFSEEINGDFKKFIELFVSQDGNTLRSHGLFWVIDDFVGVFYMTHITETEAQVHYSFFDQRAKGREDLTRAMLKHVFEEYGFWRLSIEVPTYVSSYTTRFVKTVGFSAEGRKRKAVLYNNDKFDVICYGILAEELS